MSRLVWGELKERKTLQGADRGAYYPKNGLGVAWNGLLAVKEGSDDAVRVETHLDGVKITNQETTGAFSAVVKCFTYPEDLDKGSPFDFSYRTFYGGKPQIHLVYNARAVPSEKSYPSINDSPQPIDLEFNLSTKPLIFQDKYRLSHLIVDANISYEWVVKSVEDALYGESGDPRMLTPEEVFEIYQEGALLKVHNNGDGTYTITGPESAVKWLDDDTVQLKWPSVIWLNEETFQISSL